MMRMDRLKTINHRFIFQEQRPFTRVVSLFRFSMWRAIVKTSRCYARSIVVRLTPHQWTTMMGRKQNKKNQSKTSKKKISAGKVSVVKIPRCIIYAQPHFCIVILFSSVFVNGSSSSQACFVVFYTIDLQICRFHISALSHRRAVILNRTTHPCFGHVIQHIKSLKMNLSSKKSDIGCRQTPIDEVRWLVLFVVQRTTLSACAAELAAAT